MIHSVLDEGVASEITTVADQILGNKGHYRALDTGHQRIGIVRSSQGRTIEVPENIDASLVLFSLQREGEKTLRQLWAVLGNEAHYSEEHSPLQEDSAELEILRKSYSELLRTLTNVYGKPFGK